MSETKFQKVNTKDIVINPLAQRDVEARKGQFNKIMRTFNPDLVNPVKVAFINGKFYCFDGQMTMKVLKARNGGKDLNIDCKVYYGLLEPDLADLFVAQNGTARPVEFVDKVRVMNNFGDPEMVDFVRKTEANGLEISWKRAHGRNAVNAVSALYNCYKELRPTQGKEVDQYPEFVQVIKASWDGDQRSLRTEILRGVSLFMKTYVGRYETKRLVRRLSQISPEEIIRDASVDRSSGVRKYAVKVLQVYNKSMREPLPNIL